MIASVTWYGRGDFRVETYNGTASPTTYGADSTESCYDTSNYSCATTTRYIKVLDVAAEDFYDVAYERKLWRLRDVRKAKSHVAFKRGRLLFCRRSRPRWRRGRWKAKT